MAPIEVNLDKYLDPAYLSVEAYQDLFTLGFTIPLITYLVAWGYQEVITFATKD